METPLVAIIGPTAVGKTGLVMRLADRFGAEIISVDSMQIYRHMDIGTAKASRDQRESVTHHLLDIRSPGDILIHRQGNGRTDRPDMSRTR